MKSYPSLAQGWALFLIYVLFTALATFLVMAISGNGLEGSSASFLLAYTLAGLFTILYGILKSGQRLVPVIGEISKSSYLIFPLSLISALLIGAIVNPIATLIPGSEILDEMLRGANIKDDWTSFVALAVAAPIIEEFLFRGIILEGFLKNYDPKRAIIQSSAIFGVFHLNPWQFLIAFALGLLLGWLYYRTRSLLPCLFVHFGNNLLAFLAYIYIEDDGKTLFDLFPIPYIVLGIILAGVGLYFGIKALDKLMAPEQQLIEINSEENEPETETE